MAFKKRGPLNPDARKVGKRVSGGHLARAQIEAEIKDREMKTQDGLQYVKFGKKWVSIADTAEIERIIQESAEG